MIEAGIEMVNEVGEEHLSLRKVAARCGVSNAAPYAHFTDKEDMLNAMREYVLFFHRNPHYFPFLFSQSS